MLASTSPNFGVSWSVAIRMIFADRLESAEVAQECIWEYILEFAEVGTRRTRVLVLKLEHYGSLYTFLSIMYWS